MTHCEGCTCTPPRTITLHYQITVELTEDDIWPDGDGPAAFVEDDILQEIRDDGGALAVLVEWDLLKNRPEYELTVEIL